MADGLEIDAHAELRRRAKRRPILHPADNERVARALGCAIALAYFADLRPFAAWVEKAVAHGRRVGAPPLPPSPRAESRFVHLAPYWDVVAHLGAQVRTQGRHFEDLGAMVALATTAFDAAHVHGVRADEFLHAAEAFLRAWRLLGTSHEFVPVQPPHREADLFRSGLAFALATIAPEAKPGPTGFALLLAAIGSDEPIRRDSEHDPATAAIARRAERYRDVWSTAAKRAADNHARYIVLPGVPVPLRSGDASRLRPPFRLLPDGRALAFRPAGIPPNARVTIKRRGDRGWFYATWRDATGSRCVVLGPAAGKNGGADQRDR